MFEFNLELDDGTPAGESLKERSDRTTTWVVADHQEEKPPLPPEPWSGLILTAIFVGAGGITTLLISQFWTDIVSALLIGFVVATVACVKWISRYEGGTLGDNG